MILLSTCITNLKLNNKVITTNQKININIKGYNNKRRWYWGVCVYVLDWVFVCYCRSMNEANRAEMYQSRIGRLSLWKMDDESNRKIKAVMFANIFHRYTNQDEIYVDTA